METGLRRACARIATGRARLLETRARRSDEVSRLRLYLQQEFGDYAGAVDPVSGTRLVELLAEGSKAKGDLVLTVAIFDGSRLRIALDAIGRLTCTSVPPELVADLGRMLEARVADDLSSAEIVFESPDAPGVLRTVDAREVVERVVEGAASVVDRDAGIAPAAV